MMIDKEEFAVAMGMLTDRFNRPLHPSMSRFYYETLSADLTTEEFMIAARLAMRHSQFWPSPQQLIEFAKPERSIDLEAAKMFEKVRSLGRAHPAGLCWHREEVAALGDPALAGFSTIGAQERLRNLSAEDLSWARREFVAAYIAKARETKADRQIEAAREAIRIPARGRQLKPGPDTSTTGLASIGEVIPKVLHDISAGSGQ
jgi:hypothetical protein